MECHAAEKQCGGGFCVMRQSNCQGARLSEKNKPQNSVQWARARVGTGRRRLAFLFGSFRLLRHGNILSSPKNKQNPLETFANCSLNTLNEDSTAFDVNAKMKHFSYTVLKTHPWAQGVKPHLLAPNAIPKEQTPAVKVSPCTAFPNQLSPVYSDSISIPCTNLVWNSDETFKTPRFRGELCLSSWGFLGLPQSGGWQNIPTVCMILDLSF